MFLPKTSDRSEALFLSDGGKYSYLRLKPHSVWNMSSPIPAIPVGTRRWRKEVTTKNMRVAATEENQGFCGSFPILAIEYTSRAVIFGHVLASWNFSTLPLRLPRNVERCLLRGSVARLAE